MILSIGLPLFRENEFQIVINCFFMIENCNFVDVLRLQEKKSMYVNKHYSCIQMSKKLKGESTLQMSKKLKGESALQMSKKLKGKSALHTILLSQMEGSYFTPGGTRMWKWHTSASWRTKVGAFGVRFCWKKGSFSMSSKKIYFFYFIFFYVDSQKWGSFCVQKCNFKPKFANLMLKLQQNL